MPEPDFTGFITIEGLRTGDQRKQRRVMSDKHIISQEAVDAAIQILGQHFDLGGYAPVANYIRPGQTPEEREAAIQRFKVADAQASLVMRGHIADAIQAAFDAEVKRLKEVIDKTMHVVQPVADVVNTIVDQAHKVRALETIVGLPIDAIIGKFAAGDYLDGST